MMRGRIEPAPKPKGITRHRIALGVACTSLRYHVEGRQKCD
jgi:hypothetical protein